jgi:hypothetical protein
LSHRHFPHELYLVHHLPTNSYGCAFVEETRGLACFTRPAAARHFAARMETRNHLIIAVTMADACEIAALAQLNSLVLADSPTSPVIHSMEDHKSRF